MRLIHNDGITAVESKRVEYDRTNDGALGATERVAEKSPHVPATPRRRVAARHSIGLSVLLYAAVMAMPSVVGAENTVLGDGANAQGESSTAVGSTATAKGDRNTAVGTEAVAGLPDRDLFNCVEGGADVLKDDEACREFLTTEEAEDALLSQDDAEGQTFRETILTRLRSELDSLTKGDATAVGSGATASEEHTTALGSSATANSGNSTALGSSAEATRPYTTAVGALAKAYGQDATALGEGAQAGEYGTALGAIANADGERSVAVGQSAWALGKDSTVMGQDARAYFDESTAVGQRAHAIGEALTVFGRNAVAVGERNTVLGHNAVAIAEERANIEEVRSIMECLLLLESSPSRDDLLDQCGEHLTSEEKEDSRLDQDDAAGESLRETISDRLFERGEDLAVERSTAVGRDARALADRSTAIGDYAIASGYRGTALGVSSRASGDRSTALGAYADANGDRSTVVGHYSRTQGVRNTAVGTSAVAARDWRVEPRNLWDCVNAPWAIGDAEAFAERCEEYLTDEEQEDARLTQDGEAGELFRGEIRARLQGRLDDLAVERSVALGYVAKALGDRATAAGAYAVASGRNSTAVGYAAHAPANDSTAIGRTARAMGGGSTAVGGSARAAGGWSTALGRFARESGGRNITIGAVANTHGREGLAIGVLSGAGSWTVGNFYENAAAYLADEDRLFFGHLNVVIGDSVYATADLEAIGTSLSDSNLPAPLANASEIINPNNYYTTVAEYLGDANRTNYRQVVIAGKVYDVDDLEDVEDLTEESIPTPRSGAAGTVAIGVRAHATAENAVALGRDAHAVGTNAVAIGSGVTAAANEVVIGLATHAYKLPGVAASQTANTEVLTVDNTGRLAADGGALHERVQQLETSTTDLTQRVETLETSSGNNSSGDIAKGLPEMASDADTVVQKVKPIQNGGKQSFDGEAGASAGSSGDGGNPPVATVQTLAPSKPGDPGQEEVADATSGGKAANGRAVVQDTYAGNSASTHTADLSELSSMSERMNGYDERLNSLDQRLDRATAMSSALSALPNTVPDGGKLFLGLGVGHYGDKQAIALGLSARLGVKRNFFVNAGVATATGGDSVSARAGVGFVWK